MTTTLVLLQITILTYVTMGFILCKAGKIDEQGQKVLSEIVLDFLLPMSVFVSVVENISPDILRNLALILLLAAVFEAGLYLFTKLPLEKRFTGGQACVARYSYLVSNGGLIGTPVIEGLFGGVGVVICNVFLIPTRIMAFSAGESIFHPKLRKTPKEIILSVVENKVVIAIALALLFSFLKITVPNPIFSACRAVGKCMSPFSLILVGSMLGQKIELNRKMLTRILEISFVRLICIPLVALMVCKLLRLDFQSAAISTLLLGMPAGSTAAVFAKKYGGDAAFSAAVVFVTTILSTLTLVGLMALLEKLFL